MSRTAAVRLYRLLLAVAPRRLRDRHAGEMQALFAEALDEARARGPAAVSAVWMHAILDVFLARVRDLCCERSVPHLDEPRRAVMLSTDLKYACRWLLRQKFSTALIAAMLALGIAANVVAFSLVNGIFLRPFPFAAPERLVYINETAPRWQLDIVGINYPDFAEWRRSAKMFEAMGIWSERAFNLSDGSTAERIDGAQVTYDFPTALGIAPVLGRMFTAEEDAPKGAPVVLIDEDLWHQRFGGAPNVLGATLRLNGVPHTIIGVLPRTARFPGRARLWVPLAGDPAASSQSYGYDGAIGRLKPGVTAADAEKDLLRAHQGIWDAAGDREHIVSPFVKPLREQFARGFRTRANSLLAATAILMIVACANVASVMLARALVRRREMSIRRAVGATRIRLARQLLIENLLISAIGGAAGLALGSWTLSVLLAAAGDQVPAWTTFSLDWRTVAFTGAVTMATAILFGWAPVLHASRGDLRSAMHASATGTTASPLARRTLTVLVGAEFALAAVLVVSGGLLLRAYERVQHVDPGFRPEGVLTFALSLPTAYRDRDGEPPGQRSTPFWERLLDRMKALPGVDAAGVISCPPLSCHWGTFYDIEGRLPVAAGQADPVILYRPATPGYFAAMGIRLKRGRFFTAADGHGEQRSVIVNEAFVRTFWAGVSDPIGRRIRTPSSRTTHPWITVVGLVEDVKHYGLERPMIPGVYLPLAQEPASTMTVAIHTSGNPESLLPAATRIVRELEPDLAVYRARTMEQALGESMRDRRTYAWLLGSFAAIALVLALGGTYGVTSYLVSQRTREIGIRVALGARAVHVTQAVLRGSLGVVGAGLFAGAAGSVALAKQVEELLFGVTPYDPLVLTVAVGSLLLFAAAVNAIPARRAGRVDPMRTLRSE